VGIKEASGNLSQIGDIIRDRPKGFVVLSGDDSLTLPIMALGGEGVISVTSNATPRLMAQLADACASGDLAAARQLHRRLQPWMTNAFIESNPVPVKAALAMMGRIQNFLRLPLVPLAEANVGAVKASLVVAGALSS
jgi:4-hydroxy-tetrahydrodipicolinate synthase